MRVGLLSFEYPPDTGFGGIGTYTFHHAHALRRLGHEVHVISGGIRPQALSAERGDGLTIWRGQSALRPAVLRYLLEHTRLSWSRTRLETGISMYAALRQVHAQHRLDVVEMPDCGAEGLLLTHLLDVPSVVRFHSPARLIMPYYDTRRIDRLLCGALERIAMAGASSFTSCSAFLAREVAREIGRPGWRIETIPNGIDLALFDGVRPAMPDFRDRFGLPREAPLILFNGRLERRKGVHLLGPVLLSLLPATDACVVIAGDDLFGFGRTRLLPVLRAAGLDGRVRLTGTLSPAEVRAALAAADIYFMPSQWEACPYACLEAMAACKAIVAADAGGLPELLTDGADALVVPREDVTGYVAALRRLLFDGALARKLGEAARATVATRFNDITAAKRSLEFYQKLGV